MTKDSKFYISKFNSIVDLLTDSLIYSGTIHNNLKMNIKSCVSNKVAANELIAQTIGKKSRKRGML